MKRFLPLDRLPHGTIEVMKKLDFLFFDAGGGHRAAANALRQVIERQARPLEIRMVNLQERLDSAGRLPQSDRPAVAGRLQLCSRRAGRWVRRN